MHKIRPIISEQIKGVASVLLALALVLRIVAAPVVLAAPEPGLMAICSGGKIIYISMETGLPVDTQDGPDSLDCPLVLAAHVLTTTSEPFSGPQPVLLGEMPVQEPLRLGVFPRFGDYRSRAPPVMI